MFGINKGGGGTAGAPLMSPRPAPRPDPSTAAPPNQPQFGGGLFPGMSSQARYDLAMSMLDNGMKMASQSSSPVAAFLAPLAGAAIGGGIESRYGRSKKAETDEMLAAMTPGSMNPEMTKVFDVAMNEEAPELLRSLAKKRIEDMMNPPKAARGGGTGAGPAASGGHAKNGIPLYGEIIGTDGFIYGRTKTGEILPYTGQDGKPFRPAAKSSLPGVGEDDLGFDGDASPGTLHPIIIDGYSIQQVN